MLGLGAVVALEEFGRIDIADIIFSDTRAKLCYADKKEEVIFSHNRRQK